VIFYSGFSLFAIASFTIVALTCALIASVAVELALSTPIYHIFMDTRLITIFITVSLLLFALLANLFVSVSLTVVAISAYLVVRFAILVRTAGRVGVSEWATETKGHFLHAKAKILPKFDYHEGSDTSTGSVVVVQGNDDGVQRVES
jgi:adenosylcobinamide amidohydrolase